ncbi:hypothetical protein LINPERPRIM_LOCUS20407 [Linum perenne]
MNGVDLPRGVSSLEKRTSVLNDLDLINIRMRKQEKQLRPLSVSWRIQRLIITLARSMLLVEPLMRKSILVVFAVLVLDRHHHRYDNSLVYVQADTAKKFTFSYYKITTA